MPDTLEDLHATIAQLQQEHAAAIAALELEKADKANMFAMGTKIQADFAEYKASHPDSNSTRKSPLARPPTYDGKDKAGWMTFISQCKFYIMGSAKDFPDDPTKVAFVISLLRGPAYQQFEPYATLPEHKQPLFFKDFDSFVSEAESRLGDPDRIHTLTARLRNLKQTGSAAAYVGAFKRITPFLDWNDSALQAQFLDGLKPEVFNMLALVDDNPNIDSLCDRAIKIDNRIAKGSKKQLKTQHDKSHSNKSNNHSNSNSDPGPVPMDIDATTSPRRGPLTSQERERRIKNDLCLYCGEPGHKVNQCPASKKKPRTGNATFLVTGPADSESKN